MEKENSRSREEARQQYNTTVLKLVELCKRLDPRYKKALEMKKEKERLEKEKNDLAAALDEKQRLLKEKEQQTTDEIAQLKAKEQTLLLELKKKDEQLSDLKRKYHDAMAVVESFHSSRGARVEEAGDAQATESYKNDILRLKKELDEKTKALEGACCACV